MTTIERLLTAVLTLAIAAAAVSVASMFLQMAGIIPRVNP